MLVGVLFLPQPIPLPLDHGISLQSKIVSSAAPCLLQLSNLQEPYLFSPFLMVYVAWDSNITKA